MIKKILIVCPANTVTGGPLLLHQLCYTLRNAGYDAVMFYDYDINYADDEYCPVALEYKKFQNPYVKQLIDAEDVVIILPEIYFYLADSFYQATCVYWWLSVDGFYNVLGRMIHEAENMSVADLLKTGIIYSSYLHKDNILHLVQSQYAWEHCRHIGISETQIRYLSDYLDPVFIEQQEKNHLMKKNNYILYNPKKGYQFTKKLMEKSPQWEWIPLAGYSAEEMAVILRQSKVYIDFGEHPGKDRIPREAAINGCCVLTGKKGSAENDKDIPIPDRYKFADVEDNIPCILEKIEDIFKNYEQCQQDFFEYKKSILTEEEKFKADVKKIFAELAGDDGEKTEKVNKANPFLAKAYERLQSKR